GPVRQRLRGSCGVEYNEYFLGRVRQSPRISEQTGSGWIVPFVRVRAEPQRRIKPPEVVQFRHPQKLWMRHVEIIAERRTLLELSGKHVFAIVWICAAVEGLLGPVIQARHSARRVQKSQRNI